MSRCKISRDFLAVLLSLTCSLSAYGNSTSYANIGQLDTSMSASYEQGSYRVETRLTFADTSQAYSTMMLLIQFYAANNPNGMYYDIQHEKDKYKITHKLSPYYTINGQRTTVQESLMGCEGSTLFVTDFFAKGLSYEEHIQLIEMATGNVMYDGKVARK